MRSFGQPFAVSPSSEVTKMLAALKASPATTKAKARFILATDGTDFEAEDLESGETVACTYKDFPDHFGFFLPLAGITTVRQISENAFDIRATSRLNRLYVQLLKDNPEWGSSTLLGIGCKPPGGGSERTGVNQLRSVDARAETAFRTVSPTRCALGAMRTPAVCRAAILVAASPPWSVMRVPACPMRRSGGAWRPTTRATTGMAGFAAAMKSAARSSSVPPISPMSTNAFVC
jgi:hypothetical protein